MKFLIFYATTVCFLFSINQSFANTYSNEKNYSSKRLNQKNYEIKDSSKLGVIEGFIYEKSTGQPLSYATVQILETSKGGFTDETGYFKIKNLPFGTYILEATYAGLQTFTEKGVVIGETTPYNIDFNLDQSALELETIIVKPDYVRQQFKETKISISRSLIENISSGDDIMKTIQIVPGVSSPPGLNNEVNIRGGASYENRFRVDGIEIPVINHFSSTGTNSGFRSIIQSNAIQSADLHTSNFPIQLGNVSSGVFDFQLKNADEPESNVNISTADISVYLNRKTKKIMMFWLDCDNLI